MKKRSKKAAEILLVTGGAGFMGSHFIDRYAATHPHTNIVVVDALTAIADKRNIESLDGKRVSFIKADIRDAEAMRRIFKRVQPTLVAHFAAETHVDVSINNPRLFLETNVLGTFNIASCARDFGVKRLLHVSTDEVYGALSAKAPAFTEESPFRPNSPYSASKAAAEHVVRAFHETFGLDVVIARSSNNYGPKQDSSKMIPLFSKRLLAGETIPLYGTGQNVRDWIHVYDSADGFTAVLERGVSGEAYNIGAACELRNIDIVEILLDITGQDRSKISFVADRLGHDFRYALDTKKIRRLGWKPSVPFKRGIAQTVEYYRSRTRPKKR